MKQTFTLITALLLALCLVASPAFAADLVLSTLGKTDFRIVKPANPSAVDHYALTKLSEYLRQITGAEFPVLDADKATGDSPCLYVGVSAAVSEKLGAEPLKELKDQEHVSRSKGGDIFLYGKGVHGNLHAVMEFLETSLGWRWFTFFEKPVLPRSPEVALEPFNRTKENSYLSRETALHVPMDFFYQLGINMGYDRKQQYISSPGILSRIPNEIFTHSLFAYIPPTAEARSAKTFEWLEKRDYFQTNPEFFSMTHTGERVATLQLCFSNKALRKELTKNILTHIEKSGENNLISLVAEDLPGRFCYCPSCESLEKKFGSIGGPIYDYLLELCGVLHERHPRTMVKTAAYRRAQTQKPPVLPDGGKLPANLIIDFAPIEDSYFADWTHPDALNQETYADLKAWNTITVPGNLWAWLYPNGYGSGAVMPVGNIERNIINIRMMHQAGVRGLFIDHNGFHIRAGLSELQHYLFCKLMQDVNTDTDRHIREFTDHVYGPAAPLARKYMEELEEGRKAIKVLLPGITHNSGRRFGDEVFPYLTVGNIHRWQTSFDQMEQAVKGDSTKISAVKVLRRELDFATLLKWHALRDKYPEYFKDPDVIAERVRSVNSRGLEPRTLEDFLAVAKTDGKEKPLPEEFKDVDPSKIVTLLPTNTEHLERNHGQGLQPEDPDAARGYAASVHMPKPELPLSVGFFQWESRQPPKGTHGPKLQIGRSKITPGKYRVYKLGEITLTPDSMIWFAASSWATQLETGFLCRPGETNLWDAWVSLKFEGPAYGGGEEANRVLCDRIILVKKP